MTLSLLAIVAIYKVLSVWDGRRRSITAGSSAQISGSIGILEIERDLQLSGWGFGNISAASRGCTVHASNSSFAASDYNFLLAPVEIVNDVSGAPDVINIFYGNSAYVSNIHKLRSSDNLGKTKKLENLAGFNAGDIVLVAGNVASTQQCALFEVTGNTADLQTLKHDTNAYTSYYVATPQVTPTMNSAAVPILFGSGEIHNLGPDPQRTQWAVSAANVLTRRNTLRSETSTFEVTEGIANLQAQYGIDGGDEGTTLDDKISDTEWLDALPSGYTFTSAHWPRMLAVRIAVLARSSQLEKGVVTPVAPFWSGGDFVMKNLDGSSGTTSNIAKDWRHYRYRVYETTIPLRNMIWGASS